MNLEWSLDGPQISILVDLDQELQSPTGPIGTVSKNPDNTWTAYDCTRSNQHGTTAFPVGTKPTREEAKRMVEECFRTPMPEGSQGQPTADFTARLQELTNRWSMAVERRWSEVCQLLENHISRENVLPAHQLPLLLHELATLHLISQYAGSNARTGWLIAIKGYREAIIPEL